MIEIRRNYTQHKKIQSHGDFRDCTFLAGHTPQCWWRWLICLKLHWAKSYNGLVHLYTSSLSSSFHRVLPLCSSLKHTLCKWHNFQTAQQALFTQLSDHSRLACTAVLCSSKCVFRVWREGIASVPLLEPWGSATKSFYRHECGEILHARRWNKRTSCSSVLFEIILWKNPPPLHSPLCFHWTRWKIQ